MLQLQKFGIRGCESFRFSAWADCANKRSVGGKIVASIEGIFGGEVTAYTSKCEKAGKKSLNRLIENARKMGANAVVGVDFETSDILQGTATVFAVYEPP